jgi:hypothetical protein
VDGKIAQRRPRKSSANLAGSGMRTLHTGCDSAVLFLSLENYCHILDRQRASHYSQISQQKSIMSETYSFTSNSGFGRRPGHHADWHIPAYICCETSSCRSFQLLKVEAQKPQCKDDRGKEGLSTFHAERMFLGTEIFPFRLSR